MENYKYVRGAVNDRIVHEVSWVSGLVNVANGLTKDTDTGNNIHYLLEYNRLAVSTKREDEDRQYRMDVGKQYLLNENKLLGANKQDVLAKVEKNAFFKVKKYFSNFSIKYPLEYNYFLKTKYESLCFIW